MLVDVCSLCCSSLPFGVGRKNFELWCQNVCCVWLMDVWLRTVEWWLMSKMGGPIWGEWVGRIGCIYSIYLISNPMTFHLRSPVLGVPLSGDLCVSHCHIRMAAYQTRRNCAHLVHWTIALWWWIFVAVSFGNCFIHSIYAWPVVLAHYWMVLGLYIAFGLNGIFNSTCHYLGWTPPPLCIRLVIYATIAARARGRPHIWDNI